MLWINEELVSYDKAINGLNFDKLGHETGLGSWGALLTVEDSFDTPLSLFIGLKFDVVSIITNRFITTFVNIPREIKERSQKLRGGRPLSDSISGISNFIPDIDGENVITFYIDTHRVDIDVVEMSNVLYKYADTTEEYAALARDVVFLSGGKRASRAISASMLRVYDGNLENFGFIFTRSGVNFVLNEMMVDEDLLNDEIKFTYWLTPHDREEYSFFENNNNVKAEGGSEFVDGLGVEKVSGYETDKLYQYDRRGMRNGYYDITVENPLINSGYTDGTIEVHDTFQYTKDTGARIHKHKAGVEIDAGYQDHTSKVLSSLVPDEGTGDKLSKISQILTPIFKLGALKMMKDGYNGSFTDTFNSTVTGVVIDAVLEAIELTSEEIPDSTKTYVSNNIKDTLVIPLAMMNKMHSFEDIDVQSIYESIVFIYHPVIDKFVFYEFGQNDPAIVTEDSIIFTSDGTRYGIDMSGNDNEFIWSNFKKKFRLDSSRWINAYGEVSDNDTFVEESSRSLEPLYSVLSKEDSGVPYYDDLTFEGKSAKIMVINKKDIREIVRKTHGEVAGEYILGLKTGDVEIVRDGLWM